MRSYDTDDLDDLKILNAADWQIELLKKNPDYPFWGNYEDYMSGGSGWAKPAEMETWEEHFTLDDLNELVNFYFEVYRVNHQCPHCEGSGMNEATKELADSWYSFDEQEWIYLHGGRKTRYNNKAWQYHLTEHEIEALMRSGRLVDLMPVWTRYDEEKDKWFQMDRSGEKPEWVECPQPVFPTPEKVNEWAKTGFGHDGINQWICVRARAEKLGVYGHCEHCEEGVIYDEPTAKVGLQLWYLHPRKGCSRGVYIKNITEENIPEVIAYLKEAAERNANRFSKL